MTVRPLSKELQEKAISELNEVPEQVYEYLEELKQWLSTQDYGKKNMDDQWLLSFLRGCKFNLQKTKSKLDFFYFMREKSPEFFNNRDPLLPEIQDILRRGILIPVQNKLDPAGPPLLMVRWEKVNYQKLLFADLVKVSLMSLDILVKESDSFIIAGQQIVQDFNGFSVRFMAQLTPGVTRKCILCLQNAYPTRIKGVHFVNVPAYFRIIFNLVHPFLSKKLKQRVKVYGSNAFQEDNIYKDLHPSLFPKEYDGEGGSADELAKKWKEKVESYRDWFLEDSS